MADIGWSPVVGDEIVLNGQDDQRAVQGVLMVVKIRANLASTVEDLNDQAT